ncbi:exodeoxyribonuclease V subunit gamma [Candidatus Erwinia haradaeae]|uniref:RecBCD enzyme subunit RecC n=1 Tax=Candidatus Erwinia haradaeae TaxID=1922217 RepID=A0A451D8G3_9GAMM|nr:exodeoxyribonuclease V subunit gamma [Candidatus Erwinia haradaeae]VFP82108.1 RecBCD enzyme subunit RecC [Candidatus Erwinia haradaeae]
MLTIYHSNDLEMLKNLVCSKMENKPLVNPLCPEVFLVQSLQMREWLKIQLSEELGIAANIDFFLPSAFIWDMFARVFPFFTRDSAFNQFNIRWKLRALFPTILLDKSFSMIRQYLSDDQEYRKLFQLTERIAQLFEQYSIHKPEWLNAWENGAIIENGLGVHQEWQSKLWMELVKYTNKLGESIWHRASLYQYFISTLQRELSKIPNLPSRIFIFGFSALPAEYLEALGKHTDIYLMCVNPCRYYWGDIQEYQFFKKLKNPFPLRCKNTKPIEKLHGYDDINLSFSDVRKKEEINPLLASWGQWGRQYFVLLEKTESYQVSSFVDIATTSLINILKRDVLEGEDHSVIGVNRSQFSHSHTKRILSIDDRSIEIHLCHSAKREVEVLRDQLLNMMEKDSALSVRDIIVMVSDMNVYAPFIESVFGDVSLYGSIPFTISDPRVITQPNLVFQAFIKLLILLDSRFTSEEVFSFLEVPIIASRFSINPEGLSMLRKWVVKSGVRWGLDDDVFYETNLPVVSQHTWRYGLTRMFLGHAMDSEEGLWEGVLPFDECRGLMAEVIGNFAEFLMKLTRWKKWLSQPLGLSSWLLFCRQIMDDFFLRDSDNATELELIEQKWNKVVNYGIDSLYQQDVPLSRLREELELEWSSQIRSDYSIGAAINFCSLTSMGSMPIKVVCLLGMNDGVYPRLISPCSFDLMQQNIQREHFHSSRDDPYLFLEIVCSVQEKLYISYIFRSIEDDTVCYPSILVSKLIDYISQSFCLPEDRDKDPDSSSKAVVQHLQYLHNRMLFPEENFTSQSKFYSIDSECLSSFSGSDVKNSSFIQSLLRENKINISLHHFLNFWTHPVRSFFQSRLGVYFQIEECVLPDTELFILDRLSCYQVNSQLLDHLINDKKTDYLYKQVRASGLLPYGSWGDIFWREQEAKMSEIATKIQSYRTKLESRNISLIVDGFVLTGSLTDIQVNGLLRWSPSMLRLSQGLRLWLEHLVYCATGGTGFSLMLGCNNSLWHFLPLSVDNAYKYLLDYINGYRLGMRSPLLLTCSGGQWLQACFDQNTGMVNHNEVSQKKAYRKLLQCWEGNKQIAGEKSDVYLQRLLPCLNKDRIQLMTEQAELWYISVLRYNQV